MTLVYSLVIFSLFVGSYVFGENHKLSRIDQKMLKSFYVYGSITTKSAIHCCVICVRDNKCQSVSYRSSTRECRFSKVNGNFEGNLVSATNWMVFARPAPEINCNINRDVEHWVSAVTGFSSQYDTTGWSASKIIGAPDVYPSYGDFRGTWAQSVKNSQQYIKFQFPEPLLIECLYIYETWHAGGVKSVLGKDPQGQWQELWKTDTVQVIRSSRIFTPSLQYPGHVVQEIRLDIDCSLSTSWVEIDAVKVGGTRGLDF